jgi:hypothetical protein
MIFTFPIRIYKRLTQVAFGVYHKRRKTESGVAGPVSRKFSMRIDNPIENEYNVRVISRKESQP